MKINGTPVNHGFPTKKISGSGKGRGGCLPSLFVLAVIGTGWASMVLTSWRSA